jgi:hypothetical protein
MAEREPCIGATSEWLQRSGLGMIWNRRCDIAAAADLRGDLGGDLFGRSAVRDQ